MVDCYTLTYVILPRLSCEDSVHWLYWNSRTWSSSDVIVILKWCHQGMYYLIVFRSPFYNKNAVFNGEQEKESINCVMVG